MTSPQPVDAHDPRHDRTIVSFVRRSPRMNSSQEQALERGQERFGVAIPNGDMSTSIAPDAELDLDALFGRPVGPGGSPLILEIGCGTGDSLSVMAKNRPDASILAFEVYLRAVGSTFVKLEKLGVENARVAVVDGAQALEQLIAPDTVSELWTFFPDPWQKKRHHKRRLVDDEFAALVTSRLIPGGRWRLATDWDDYAEQMREVLDAAPGLTNEGTLEGGWADRGDRPVTRFEKRGINAGRAIRDLCYRKVQP